MYITNTDSSDLFVLYTQQDGLYNNKYKTYKTQQKQDEDYFDFCIALNRQHKVIKEWLEEYIFLRDEAYEKFSYNPSEYNAICLRQISNYLDIFLEANRLLEIVLDDLRAIKKIDDVVIKDVRNYTSVIDMMAQSIAQEIDRQILTETIEYVEQQRSEQCNPIYDGSNFNIDTMRQYSVSGTLGTFDTESFVRVSVG